MQIYALNTDQSLVQAHNAQRGLNYLCPECGHIVRLRGGNLRQLHFYHPDSFQCAHLGKSLAHLHIQFSLKKMLDPELVLLEHRFPEIGRIADVFWPAKKLIFEVQVSPISHEEVRQRTHDYKQLGYTVVWILHDSNFNRSKVTKAEIYLRSLPHYFTNINAFGRGIFYDQYSFIHYKRRIKRTARFSVSFKKMIAVNLKQIPRQVPLERQKWPFAFQGDLLYSKATWTVYSSGFTFTDRLFYPYKLLLNFFLEKTTN